MTALSVRGLAPPSGPLLWGVLLCLAMLPPTLALLRLDPRVLDGETLWLKPLKFQLSLALHGATLLWIFSRLPEGLTGSRLVTGVSVAVGVTTIYEVLFLALQAARGVRSHFNRDTAFDQVGGSLMAGGAGVLTLAPALVGVALLGLVLLGRTAPADRPLHLALAMGLLLSGWLGAATGGAIGANRGPFVGPELGPHLPLTGWALGSGDLRIAHFLGMHALQALPLAGLLLWATLPAPAALAALVAVAGAWTAATLGAQGLAEAGRGLLSVL